MKHRWRNPKWWCGVVVGVLAFAVMPDGPWYRQLGAFVLVSVACSLWAACAIESADAS